jgi:hypothetical protein
MGVDLRFQREHYEQGGAVMDINYILMLHGQIRDEKKKPKIYGVAIDLNNSNPKTCVTYTDDAIVMVPGEVWDNYYPFNAIVPVLLDGDGNETAQLTKNDFSKDINGNPVNITSGDNVMIKIPRVWFKIETVGDILYCKIADAQVDETYKAYGHFDGLEYRDAFYVGAFLGYNHNNVLKSWSEQVPTGRITIAEARNYARANGHRYNVLGFYQMLVLQLLQLIYAKHLHSQEYYGKGHTYGEVYKPTGDTINKGLFEIDQSSSRQVKLLGIEDFYGNYRYWIDGIKTDENFNILTCKVPAQFNNDGFGYDLYPSGLTARIDGYISKVQGTSELGFIIKEANGTSSTNFCDNGRLYENSYAIFGAIHGSGSSGGSYALRLSQPNGYGSEVVGRIMYL